jgi:hypothetical protein
VDTTTLLLSLSQMALAIAGFSGITIAFYQFSRILCVRPAE